MKSLKELRDVVKQKLSNAQFVVVSHSEPYTFFLKQGKISWHKAGGGLVAALDPIMQACNGTWIAFSASETHKEGANKHGLVSVPPNKPTAYTLDRIYLSEDELENYLDGAANSAIWPWCSSLAYVRPEFNDSWWRAYREVNKKFAEETLKVVGNRPGFVWIQDYQLSLCAKYIKEKRPDLVTAHFWHIPWLNPETFSVCPWGQEMLEAMLCNDLVGFQIQYYANNFMDCVDQTLQARVKRETNRVHYKNSETLVKAFPISIDYEHVKKSVSRMKECDFENAKSTLGAKGEKLVVAVDRMDYSKGIAEKFLAFDIFLEKYPEYIGKITLVQVASPTRSHVPAYRENARRVERLAKEINWKWKIGKSKYFESRVLGVFSDLLGGNENAGEWTPIVLHHAFADEKTVHALYKYSDACLVTSLHDGMNLVSKEFVAANEKGMLVLSKFTGASRALRSAVQANPYALEEVASSLKHALEMPEKEKKERMKKMKEEIKDSDVYRWAKNQIEQIAKLESTTP